MPLLWSRGSNHTPSPGASTAKEKGSACPAQGRRECETVMRQVMQIVDYVEVNGWWTYKKKY